VPRVLEHERPQLATELPRDQVGMLRDTHAPPKSRADAMRFPSGIAQRPDKTRTFFNLASPVRDADCLLRAVEQSSSRAVEQSSTRAPEHPSTRAPRSTPAPQHPWEAPFSTLEHPLAPLSTLEPL
jgi:hypothetical protein